MAPPRTLGPYQLDRELGSNGISVVYTATDTRSQVRTAVKIIGGYGDDTASKEHVLHHMRNAARLLHRHAVAVREIGLVPGDLHGGGVYVAMEMLDGQVLADVLREQRHLAPVEATEIGTQVCEAIEAAHELGIVHGNLRPSNVVLVEDPRTLQLTVKVTDFGVPLAPPTQSPLPEGPRRKLAIRTAPYRAPEQNDGHAPDVRSDIYSIGVLLDRMLTGKSWDFEDPKLPRSLRARAPERAIPAALDDVVQRCLARRPDDRWGSVKALSVALAAALKTPMATSVATPSLTLREDEGALFDAAVKEARAPRPSRRQPPPVPSELPPPRQVAIAVVVIVVVVFGIVALVRPANDNPLDFDHSLVAAADAKNSPEPAAKPPAVVPPPITDAGVVATIAPPAVTDAGVVATLDPPPTTTTTTTTTTPAPAVTAVATTPTTATAATAPATTTATTTAATATTTATTPATTKTAKPTTTTTPTTTTPTTATPTTTTTPPTTTTTPTPTTTTPTTAAENPDDVFEHVHTGAP